MGVCSRPTAQAPDSRGAYGVPCNLLPTVANPGGVSSRRDLNLLQLRARRVSAPPSTGGPPADRLTRSPELRRCRLTADRHADGRRGRSRERRAPLGDWVDSGQSVASELRPLLGFRDGSAPDGIDDVLRAQVVKVVGMRGNCADQWLPDRRTCSRRPRMSSIRHCALRVHAFTEASAGGSQVAESSGTS